MPVGTSTPVIFSQLGVWRSPDVNMATLFLANLTLHFFPRALLLDLRYSHSLTNSGLFPDILGAASVSHQLDQMLWYSGGHCLGSRVPRLVTTERPTSNLPFVYNVSTCIDIWHPCIPQSVAHCDAWHTLLSHRIYNHDNSKVGNSGVNKALVLMWTPLYQI